MKKFKEKGEGRLEPNEVQLMQEVYPDIKALAGSGIANNLNVSCPTCIREALHVFVSVFDRLANDPHVTEANPATDGAGKADGVFDPTQAAKDAANAQAKALEYTDEDDAALRELVGVTAEASPWEFREALELHIGDVGEANVLPKYLGQRDKLNALIASLPPVVVEKAEPTANPPAVESDKITTGTAINTPATHTEKQKAAETKAKTVVKNTEKVVKEQLGDTKKAPAKAKKAAK